MGVKVKVKCDLVDILVFSKYLINFKKTKNYMHNFMFFFSKE